MLCASSVFGRLSGHLTDFPGQQINSRQAFVEVHLPRAMKKIDVKCPLPSFWAVGIDGLFAFTSALQRYSTLRYERPTLLSLTRKGQKFGENRCRQENFNVLPH